jgi:PAS domain S-box-containing protein
MPSAFPIASELEAYYIESRGTIRETGESSPMTRNSSNEELNKRIRDLEGQNKTLQETVRSLRDNEEMFRALYENAPVMIASFRSEGFLVLWNKECEKKLGWTENDLVSSPNPLALVYPDQALRARVVKEIKRFDGIFREYEATAKDSTKRIQLWASFRLPTGTVISLGHDITEVKLAEQALKKGEQDFRDLIENFPTGIAIVVDENVVYRNTEQQKIFGRLPETYFPSLYDQTHPDDIAGLRQLYQSALSGQVQQQEGLEFRHYPSGDITDTRDMRWIHFRVTPIEYQGRKAVLFNMIDVTKSREMERLLNIQDRMASLGRVAAGIAHEIRNPLSGINIYVNALEKLYMRSDLEKMKDVLLKIQSASSKIESVIKRVMDFSKPSEPKRIQIDIRKPIEDALGLSSVMLRKNGIKVETMLMDGLPPCYADPQLIEQVILNLITNAAEAMKDMVKEKKIEISTSRQDDSVCITLTDSGPGIPSSLRQKVFDPFYTTKSGSTGIGLSLSHRIILDHKGRLSVAEGKGGGAEFIILIPIHKRYKGAR